ncbi:MAG: hypothetical protein QF415_10205 [Candidatus Undinarchaeales archaeon]|jgi:hypothetical protein|nr:hypothetical protein [Candidatus Undinarchaeales archaeon]MDP7494200.1 hypothetical protein [Candidatus Undinarchaeales archaeon]
MLESLYSEVGGPLSSYGIIDDLEASLGRIEEVFNQGTYIETWNGYVVSAGGYLPEAPKMFIYEDEGGLHIEGRGDDLSEDPWLNVQVETGSYARDESGFYVGSDVLDGRTLSIARAEERLIFMLTDGMVRPPIFLYADILS